MARPTARGETVAEAINDKAPTASFTAREPASSDAKPINQLSRGPTTVASLRAGVMLH
jgi:hypothetical protein